jgi:hypothetical protein
VKSRIFDGICFHGLRDSDVCFVVSGSFFCYLQSTTTFAIFNFGDSVRQNTLALAMWLCQSNDENTDYGKKHHNRGIGVLRLHQKLEGLFKTYNEPNFLWQGFTVDQNTLPVFLFCFYFPFSIL